MNGASARSLRLPLGLAALCALIGTAAAQRPGTVVDIEVPVVVLDAGITGTSSEDDALDLANIVQSAAKGVTTVQEAPAIVTVVTADEIKDRMFQDLTQLYDTVPGWQRIGIYHSMFHNPSVRGQVQAVQFLRDGLSLFDSGANISATTRMQPMELIKRVEFITGPGGVLWGSNSLLGILNVITKDAEDVEGIEVGGQLGHGGGDRQMARAYVMAGDSDVLDGKLKLFGHGSFETYQGNASKLPMLLFHSALPQPAAANTYGPLTETDQAQSLLVNLSGKLTFGDLKIRVSAPFSRKYNPGGLSGNPSREDLPEDARCQGPDGVADPTCTDPLGKSRLNRADIFDRYAVAEYTTRFAKDKAGLTMRVYGIQFTRTVDPLQVLTPSVTVRGGLSLDGDFNTYRYGGAFDADVELSRKLRVLYGAEMFHDLKENATNVAVQGSGTISTLPTPYDLARLPLQCPRIFDADRGTIVPVANCPLIFMFPADRTVVGAYVNPQYRPTKKLILDAGARLSVAPESLGSLSYPVNTTFAGSLVYNFIPNWYVKLNYTQGFRPPVFNNTASNGEGVQIGGNPDLGVETSDALQAEVNARIFKGERRIRELAFRIDASYTRLNNLIQVASGQYEGDGKRGLASVEFLGKLYVQGGHRLELGYTYLQGDTSDKGRLRALPEHWFDLATVFHLSDKLSATSRLKVTGAAEDPNRLVEYRNSTFNEMGSPVMPVTVPATDLVLDRLPPIAELSLGVQYMPSEKLAIRATAYNALVGHSYQPDVFFDYEPHLEFTPNPFEGFRAYISAMYHY